jgi:limonene-1,2-epoxide hydrolase
VRRLFYVAFGATAGVLVVRRVSRAANKWTPEGLAAQAGGAGERIALWWAEVQALAAQRETELREALGLEKKEGSAA